MRSSVNNNIIEVAKDVTSDLNNLWWFYKSTIYDDWLIKSRKWDIGADADIDIAPIMELVPS